MEAFLTSLGLENSAPGSAPSSRNDSCVARLVAIPKCTYQSQAFDVRLHSRSLTAWFIPSHTFIPSLSHIALPTLSSPSAEPDLFHIPSAQVRRLRQIYLTRPGRLGVGCGSCGWLMWPSLSQESESQGGSLQMDSVWSSSPLAPLDDLHMG